MSTITSRWTVGRTAAVVGLLAATLVPLGSVGAAPAEPKPPETTTQPEAPLPNTYDDTATSGQPIAIAPGQPLGKASSTRKSVTITAVTPKRGNTSVVRVLVLATKRPQLSVNGHGATKALRKVTAVGGVKALDRSHHRTYGITVALAKLRKGSHAQNGKLRIHIAAPGLSLIGKNTYANTMEEPIASSHMCANLRSLDPGLHGSGITVKMENKRLFGPAIKGFAHLRIFGAYVVQRACGVTVPASFTNVVENTSSAATPSANTQPATPEPINTDPGSEDAVVLVQGWNGGGSFQTPDGNCPGRYGYLTQLADGLKAAGIHNVFEVPASTEKIYNGGPAITSSVPGCSLPAGMQISDVYGTLDENGAALARFLNHISETWNIKRVWLVGHSDGGMWSRAVVDHAAAMPNIEIKAINTIDTPHNGSYLAAVAGWLQTPCTGSVKNEVLCILEKGATKTAVALLTKFVKQAGIAKAGANATYELSGEYSKQWNARMKGVLGQIPLYASSATAVDLPKKWPNWTKPLLTNALKGKAKDGSFVFPNDVFVGLGSQQATGLQSAGVIPSLSCHAPVGGIHTGLPNSFMEGLDMAGMLLPNSSTQVYDNPQVINDIAQSISGTPNTSACPRKS